MALKKIRGGHFRLPSGEIISRQQMAYIKQLQKANQNRRYYQTKKLEPYVKPSALKQKGKTAEQITVFRPRKISLDFRKIKTKAEFDKKMIQLKEVTSKDYITTRVNAYRENLKTAIDKVFGDYNLAEPLKQQLDKVSDSNFQIMMIRNEYELSIDYVYYDEDEIHGKYEQILDIFKEYSSEEV